MSIEQLTDKIDEIRRGIEEREAEHKESCSILSGLEMAAKALPDGGGEALRDVIVDAVRDTDNAMNDIRVLRARLEGIEEAVAMVPKAMAKARSKKSTMPNVHPHTLSVLERIHKFGRPVTEMEIGQIYSDLGRPLTEGSVRTTIWKLAKRGVLVRPGPEMFRAPSEYTLTPEAVQFYGLARQHAPRIVAMPETTPKTETHDTRGTYL